MTYLQWVSDFLSHNYTWLFDGAGLFLVLYILKRVYRIFRPKKGNSSSTIINQNNSSGLNNVYQNSTINNNTIVTRNYGSEIDDAAEHLKKKEPEICISKLQKIEKDGWALLTDYERYRVKANIGLSYYHMGEYEKAGQFLVDGYHYAVENIHAMENGILGFLLIGQKEKASSIANCLVAKAPCSQGSVISMLRVGDLSLNESLKYIPAHLMKDAEILSQLSIIAHKEAKYSEAYTYALTAHHELGDNPMPILLLSEAAIDIAKASLREGKQLTSAQTEKLNFSSTLCKNLVDMTSARTSCFFYRSALLNHGAIAFLQENNELAEKIYNRAYWEFAGDSQICKDYAIILMRNKNFDKALEVLLQQVQHGLTLECAVILAEISLLKKDRDLISRSYQYLLQLVDEAKKVTNIEEAEQFCKVFVQAGICLEKSETLETFHEISSLTRISNIMVATIEVSALLYSNRVDEAKKRAYDIIANKNVCNSLYEAFMAAMVFSELSMHEEGYSILSRFVEEISNNDPTILLLNLSLESNNHAAVLDICQTLRRKRFYLLNCIDIELFTLTKLKEYEKCISICREVIAGSSDAFVQKYMRTRLSTFGIAHNRHELCERDPSLLLSDDDNHPELAPLVTRALLFSSQPKKAEEYAYKLYRKFPNDFNVCSAVLLSPGTIDGREVEITTYERVSKDCAVMFIDLSTNDNTWYIIEALPNPHPELKEFSTENPLVRAMLGLKTGDEFDMQSPYKRGRIVKIISKYVFRFQCCCDEMRTKYPEQCWFHKYSFDVNDHNSVMIKILKDQSQRVNDIFKIYNSMELPAHFLSESLQRSIYELIIMLAHTKGATIRSSHGNIDSLEKSSLFLDKVKTIYLDTTALATLTLLGGDELVDELRFGIYTSEEYVNHIRIFIENDSKPDRHVAVLFKNKNGEDGVGAIPDNHFPESSQSAQNLLNTLTSKAKFCAGESYAKADKSKFTPIAECFSSDLLYSIASCLDHRCVLVIDDRLLASFISVHFNVPCVSTFDLLVWCAHNHIIDNQSFYTYIVKLIRFNYHDIAFDSTVVIHAMQIDKFDINGIFISLVFMQFSKERIDPKSIVGIGIDVVTYIWKSVSLDITAQILTTTLLTDISKRSDGSFLVSSIKEYLPSKFGLDVFNAKLACDCISAFETGKIIRLPSSLAH